MRARMPMGFLNGSLGGGSPSRTRSLRMSSCRRTKATTLGAGHLPELLNSTRNQHLSRRGDRQNRFARHEHCGICEPNRLIGGGWPFPEPSAESRSHDQRCVRGR